MTEMIERAGYWWPVADDWCWRVIHDELPDLDLAVELCGGRALAVQAGGNVGVWAAHLAGRFARVITAEPDAVNFECLLRNVPGNVEPIRAALGDTMTDCGMHRVDGNGGAHWIAPGVSGGVAMITIDSLGLDACDLLVLDVEGAEPMALHGAKETIRRFRPVVHMEEKGLSEKYFGIRRGAAERWLVREFEYRVAERVRKDVILVPT